MPVVGADTHQTLTGVATGDSSLLEEILGLREAQMHSVGLDARTFALVKIATLIALDAPPASYAWQVGNALNDGATPEDILAVLRGGGSPGRRSEGRRRRAGDHARARTVASRRRRLGGSQGRLTPRSCGAEMAPGLPGRRMAGLAARRAQRALAEPTRWVVLSGLDTALAAADAAVTSSLAKEVVARVVASPLADDVLQRLVEQTLSSPETERLVIQTVDRAEVDRLVERMLDGPFLDAAVARVIDSRRSRRP